MKKESENNEKKPTIVAQTVFAEVHAYSQQQNRTFRRKCAISVPENVVQVPTLRDNVHAGCYDHLLFGEELIGCRPLRWYRRFSNLTASWCAFNMDWSTSPWFPGMDDRSAVLHLLNDLERYPGTVKETLRLLHRPELSDAFYDVRREMNYPDEKNRAEYRGMKYILNALRVQPVFCKACKYMKVANGSNVCTAPNSIGYLCVTGLEEDPKVERTFNIDRLDAHYCIGYEPKGNENE